MTLLTVEDLTVTIDTIHGLGHAVRNLSFELMPGNSLGIVGESGCGKSMTALSILGLLPDNVTTTGGIYFDHRNLLTCSDQELCQIRGDRISMIFQEPMTSLNPLHVVEKQLTETLLLHKRLDATAAQRRSLELLQRVRIQTPEEKLKAYPHQLSGGQRQRVMIAMALANEPDLLIADEPTTAVDVTAQAQILMLLQDLQREFGMAVLLITHDLGVVRRVADRMYVMRAGRIVESGDRDQVFNTPQQAYTRTLIDAEPPARETRADDTAAIVLRGENIRVWYPIKRGMLRRTVGHVKAANGITVLIRAGHTIGIVGESGSGKSTLALALLRLVESRGAIEFLNQPIHQYNSHQLKPLDRKSTRLNSSHW